jgi:hypothetical protein
MANNGNIEVDGFVKQRQELEKLMMSNPAMEKKVQGLIRRVLLAARREVSKAAQQHSVMMSDPRHAYKAVKTFVYRRILGGSVSLYNRRHARGESTYEPPRKLRPGQRGGNRVKRGERTNQVMHYGPLDRGWILYILNKGTGERTAGSRGGRLTGNRGSIAARNFFRPLGDRAMGQMRDNLAAAIDAEMQAILNENLK